MCATHTRSVGKRSITRWKRSTPVNGSRYGIVPTCSTKTCPAASARSYTGHRRGSSTWKRCTEWWNLKPRSPSSPVASAATASRSASSGCSVPSAIASGKAGRRRRQPAVQLAGHPRLVGVGEEAEAAHPARCAACRPPRPGRTECPATQPWAANQRSMARASRAGCRCTWASMQGNAEENVTGAEATAGRASARAPGSPPRGGGRWPCRTP